MNLAEMRGLIREEIVKIVEAETGIDNLNKASSVEDDKDQSSIDKQKLALDKEKLAFQKQKAADADRQADQREKEKEKEEDAQNQSAPTSGGEGGQPGGAPEKEKPMNINFKTQGKFYKTSANQIKNIQLSDGDLVNDDEIHYIALAVESAEGRFDKGFEKYLRKGKAGNVYGKDFNDSDIKRIMKYVKENEIVR